MIAFGAIDFKKTGIPASLSSIFIFNQLHKFYGASGGNRTPNNGSEDRCDIRFTTDAYISGYYSLEKDTFQC